MARKPSSPVKTFAPHPGPRIAGESLESSCGADSRVPRAHIWFCWAIIALAVAMAWANSLSAPFVLDDEESIVTNTSLRARDIGSWLMPPAERGETVSGRPLLNLSFALNCAAGGLNVRGYHLVNLGIHCLAGLLLFGLLRRTPLLLGPVSQEPGPTRSDVFHRARWLALVVVLLWVLHPLQTAAVTYISQRAEVLGGFFYLLTLYAFVRASRSNLHSAGYRRRLWEAVAVGACMLGIATKETVVTAPLMVWLYDRMFLAGSFRAAFRAHRNMYMGFIASWVMLGILVTANAGRGGSAGLASSTGTWTYLMTQCEAVVTYLRLAFWPVGQVFDYGMPSVQEIRAVWPQALFLLLIAGSTAIALCKKWAAGFWGAWFFVLLSPTSSVVTIATQTIAEHRMYLPLLGVILIVALSLAQLLDRVYPRLTVGMLSTLAIMLGAVTAARNEVYRSSLSLWHDTVVKRPDNPRAHHNLGVALGRAGRHEEAREAYERALALQPTHAFAHFNLGVLSAEVGDWTRAANCFRAAVEADPRYADARINLADTLRRLGRGSEGLEQYRAALELAPDALDGRTAYAAALVEDGQVAEGMSQLREVLRVDSTFADAHYELGRALEKGGQRLEAEAAYSEAVRGSNRSAKFHLARANNQRALGRMTDAEVSYRSAVRLEPENAEVRYALGSLLARRQAFSEAIAELRGALVVDPSHIEARNNLGNCLLVTGQIPEAIACYDEVLRLRPDDPMALQNREIAQQTLRESRGR
jgi:tetratricopeptide (TPR) repeat protein